MKKLAIALSIFPGSLLVITLLSYAICFIAERNLPPGGVKLGLSLLLLAAVSNIPTFLAWIVFFAKKRGGGGKPGHGRDTKRDKKRVFVTAYLATAVVIGVLSGTAITAYGKEDALQEGSPQRAPVEERISTHMSYLFKPSYKRLKTLMGKEPETEAVWKAIRAEALLLAESGGQLTLRRPSDGGIRDGKEYWNANSIEVRQRGAELYRAAKEEDFEAATVSYRAMTKSCNACHEASVILGAPPVLSPFGKGITD